MSDSASAPLSDKLITKYFNLAKNASKFSDFERQHLGCVFIYKNKVLEIGWNTMKTNPIQKEYNKFRDYKDYCNKNDGAIHAEMSTIIKTKNLENIDWKKVKVFVYRELKDGTKAMARPCKACMAAMIDRGIRDVYFTTNYNWSYERISD